MDETESVTHGGGRERETETYDDLLLQNFVDEVIRYLNHKLQVQGQTDWGDSTTDPVEPRATYRVSVKEG